MKIIKFLILTTIFLISTSISNLNCSKIKMNTSFLFRSLNREQKSEEAPTPVAEKPVLPETVKGNTTEGSESSNEDLPDIPIYYQTWVKYFHYKDKISGYKGIKKFYINNAFHFQNGTLNSQDEVIIIFYINNSMGPFQFLTKFIFMQFYMVIDSISFRQEK